MATTESDLNAAAVRAETAGNQLTQAALTIRQSVLTALSQSTALLEESRLLVARAEAAAAGVVGGGNVSSSTFTLLKFAEATEYSRPTDWLNSVSSGPGYKNTGLARMGSGGPFGLGVFCEAQNGNKNSVSSSTKIDITGPMTLETTFSMGLSDGTVMHFGDTGLDSGSIFLRVYALAELTAGKRRFRVRFKALGIDESLDTGEITGLTMNGSTGVYHVVIQRETDNKMTFRCNGQLLFTTSAAYSGTLSGYHDGFGVLQRTAQLSDCVFRSLVAQVRGKRSVVYSGSTYTVPTAPFTS